MAKTLVEILTGLANARWSELRRTANRSFMGEGPGHGWEAWKSRNLPLYEEDAVLSLLLGKDPLSGPHVVTDFDRQRVELGVKILEQVDFSQWPGLYDRIPWAELEAAASEGDKS